MKKAKNESPAKKTSAPKKTKEAAVAAKTVSIPAPDSEPMMIVNDIAKIVRAEMRRTAEEAGIPNSYRGILRQLAVADGSSQYDISKATRLKPPTVSITVRKMEASGFVRREIDEADQRVTRVFLTEKGNTFEQRNRDRISKIDELVQSSFTPEERETLMRLLLQMRTNLCEGLGIDELPGCKCGKS